MHVLSTPPAFILSQDQTLMLKFNLSEFSLAKYPRQSFLIIFTVFKVASTFVLAVLKLKSLAYVFHKLLASLSCGCFAKQNSGQVCETNLFRIFQGYFTVQLSMFFLSLLATHSLYQMFHCLSTTFLFSLSCPVGHNFYMLACASYFVKTFFNFHRLLFPKH